VSRAPAISATAAPELAVRREVTADPVARATPALVPVATLRNVEEETAL
jgi:hypothetical protein